MSRCKKYKIFKASNNDWIVVPPFIHLPIPYLFRTWKEALQFALGGKF